MNKKIQKISLTLICSSALLAGCGNLQNAKTESSSNTSTNNATITTGRVNSNVYQALMENGKYQTSAARGMSASRLNSNYNLANFQKGLLNVSQDSFSVNNYYYREGQLITAETLKKWLGRKSSENPEGLNPQISSQTEEQEKANPIIFQQVEEADFINKDTQKLEGITLGIALNKIYYTTESATAIDEATMIEKGKEAANQLLAKVRDLKGAESIPITVALFEQAPEDDIAGGHYFAQATSKNGATKISNWADINESYVSLPVINNDSNLATKDDLNSKFNSFKNDIQGFFPNLSGVTGVAYYKDNELNKLTVTIQTKYYSKTEITSFTQYVGKKAESTFTEKADLEIQISSAEGPQAYLSKSSDAQSISAHIFN